MDEGETEIITLSSDDDSKPKIVTSPKLSLKRKRTEESPESMSLKDIGNKPFLENSKKTKLSKTNLFPCDEELQSSSCNTQENKVLIETENRKKFRELLEYSKTLMEETSEEEKDKIVKKIIHQLDSTERWYASSESFSSLLDSSWRKMTEDNSNTFIILYELKKQLKKYKCKLKISCKEKEVSRINSSLSSQNTVINGFECSRYPSTSHEFHLPLEPPISSETNDDSVSKGLISEEKNNSDSQSVDTISKTLKSTLSSDIKADKSFSSKQSTSAVTFFSESSQNTVLNNEKEHDPHIFSSLVKSFISQNDAPKEKLELFISTSTSELCSPKETSKRTTTFENDIVGKKLLPDIMSSTSVHPYPSSSGNKRFKSVEDERNEMRIKRLEKTLADLDKEIKKLQQKELTLDDLDNEDSAYLKEDRYKRRFNVVWKKLCQLKKESSRTGRIVEKRFRYEGSRYKSINMAIEKLINKKKAKEKFPDFSEVLSAVKQLNEMMDMGLSERDVSLEAERVFKDVGIELQIRRMRDDEELFGCYLTDNIDLVDDPAEQDENLKKVLVENSKKFEASINEIIDVYAEKQTSIGDSEDKTEQCSAEENDDEEDDDYDDDNDQEKVASINGLEDDLPLTDPASPDLSDKDRNGADKDDIIEIRDDSEKSTDPNEVLEEKPIKKENCSDDRNIVNDSIVIEDSNSSLDLPSILELMDN